MIINKILNILNKIWMIVSQMEVRAILLLSLLIKPNLKDIINIFIIFKPVIMHFYQKGLIKLILSGVIWFIR